jgi:tetratricopeptide (TPR) repeat protein
LSFARNSLSNRLFSNPELLTKLTKLYPDHANGWVAVGVAQQRNQKEEEAIKAFEKSLTLEPRNPYALKNLGALIAHQDPASSLPYLKQAAELLPQDQGCLYDYGLALIRSENPTEGDTYLRRAIELAPNTTIAELCREHITELANQSLRKRAPGGLRLDAVMYCLGSLEKYALLGTDKTREIAMLGRSGLDSTDPTPKYHLNSLSGSFKGLQLVCMMYVGFKQIAAESDIGFDVSKEYAEAVGIFKNKGQSE